MTEQTAPNTSATPEVAADAASETPDTERLPRPRIRTGAVIWGLLLAAVGGWVLWIGTSSERREEALATLLGLNPFDWTVIVLVLVGGLVTLIALAAVIRRVQNRAHTAE